MTGVTDVTLVDLFRDVQDSLYSYSQVKDTKLYLQADLLTTDTEMSLTGSGLKSLRSGSIVQLFNPSTLDAELVRVKGVDLSSSTATVVRGVLGTGASLAGGEPLSWPAATTEVSIDPEFPAQAIVREINNAITGLAPDIHAVRTTKYIVDSIKHSYTLPQDCVGVISVDWLPIGPDNTWETLRRYRYDNVNRQVRVMNTLEPGQPIKVTWRGYPAALNSGSDTLFDAGLGNELRQVIVWGALYRLIAARLPGRLIDTRSETPLNGSYRTPDPVTAAVRQVFALYTQGLERERERQRLAWPVRPYMTF